MTCSLKDLRAFAVRNRLDVTFHVHATGAAWMVNRRGLVARPTLGETIGSGVEDTLEAADEFLLEGDKQHEPPPQPRAILCADGGSCCRGWYRSRAR